VTPGRRWRAALACAALAAAASCAKEDAPTGPRGQGVRPAGGQDPALASIAEMIDQGRADEALQRLGQRGQSAETLYLMGRAWARKAQTAPLPTPPPPPSPLPKGAPPPAPPEFKPEELQAIGFYEKAMTARPEYAAAHVGLAELLAPHALRRQAAQTQEEGASRPRRRRATPPPPLADTAGIDVSVDRVIRAYQFAMAGDPASPTLPNSLIGFGIQSGRLDAAEAGHRELLKRVREKPEPFVRYGDFLLNHKQDQDGAIEQYRQALIWQPDDEVTRAKIAEIHLNRGIQRFSRAQYALAEQEFGEAARWISDRTSAQGRRLAEYTARLREIRRR
jgi:tetratricopeptide (TPR) repeat protein